MTGAGVDDEIDTALAKDLAGSHFTPSIFTDLETETDSQGIVNQVAYRNISSVALNVMYFVRWPGFEPPWFVVNTVECKILFERNAQDLFIVDNTGTVVNLIDVMDGQANANNKSLRMWNNFFEFGPCTLAHPFVEVKVFATVGGNTEFLEADNLGFLVPGSLNCSDDPCGITVPVEGSLVEGSAGYLNLHFFSGVRSWELGAGSQELGVRTVKF
jgi:hypothetical protein